jgi:D-serine deaminase-like pyridoxal phosphate-dependent protein
VGGSEQTHSRYEALFGDVEAPFAFVDLDAMWANASDMVRRAGGKPIRLASKSVRCRAIIDRVLDEEGFSGLLTFTLPETLWLAREGYENLLLAYPTVDAHAIAELSVMGAANPATGPILMVDCVEQVDLIESVLGAGAAPVRVCMDIDAGWWALGGRVKVGPKRSPVHSVKQATDLAWAIDQRPKLNLVGLMAYEGQIAGVGDRPPGKRARGSAIRFMQERSRSELRVRRAEIVDAVRDVADLEFVNGGGTGSLESTAAEDAVTELAAGSGLYAPVQFDHYDRFALTPAAGFALPVVRRPGPGVVTALGGGYLASGVGDETRLPQPWLPEGLELDADEGAGEVQTPLLGDAADALEIGDRVYMRHVKAGELCERFDSLYLVEDGEITDEVPTYRGEGHAFL